MSFPGFILAGAGKVVGTCRRRRGVDVSIEFSIAPARSQSDNQITSDEGSW